MISQPKLDVEIESVPNTVKMARLFPVDILKGLVDHLENDASRIGMLVKSDFQQHEWVSHAREIIKNQFENEEFKIELLKIFNKYSSEFAPIPASLQEDAFDPTAVSEFPASFEKVEIETAQDSTAQVNMGDELLGVEEESQNIGADDPMSGTPIA